MALSFCLYTSFSHRASSLDPPPNFLKTLENKCYICFTRLSPGRRKGPLRAFCREVVGPFQDLGWFKKITKMSMRFPGPLIVPELQFHIARFL
jgi:hypothetical protein